MPTDPSTDREPTPVPYPIAEYYRHNGNGSGGVWKIIAAAGWCLVPGLLLAWFTAYTQRGGVSDKDMKEYVRDYSPYVQDKPILSEHNQAQDRQIGELIGGDERIRSRLYDLETYNVKDTLEKQSMKDKEKLLGDTLDEMRKGKR